MIKSRASKGVLSKPAVNPNTSPNVRDKWLQDAFDNFVQPSQSNKEIYKIILLALWPKGHGIPGPILSQQDIRDAIDKERLRQDKPPYKDVFRRLRELQGEEGFTCIIKEGIKYQLQKLELEQKREPRAKPSSQGWKEVKKKANYKCACCGAQEPDVKLSPDHRVPRSRGGGNDIENWQPLCEQCNNIKSSICQGCIQNCYVCNWAFPESYKPIVIDDDNKERIRREAETRGRHPSELVNRILRQYFNSAS